MRAISCSGSLPLPLEDRRKIYGAHIEARSQDTLARGVWHHPLLALQDGDFIVLERQGAKPDCELYKMPKPHAQFATKRYI